jgi:hypothetical protein
MKITLPLQHFVAESKKSGIEGRSKPAAGPGLADERMQVAFPGRR